MPCSEHVDRGLPRRRRRALCQADGNWWGWSLREVVIEPGATVDLGLVELPALTPVGMVLSHGFSRTRVRAQLRDAEGNDLGTICLTATRPAKVYLPRGRCAVVHADSIAATRTVSVQELRSATVRAGHLDPP